MRQALIECVTDLFSAIGCVSVEVGCFFHFLRLQTRAPHTIPCTSNTATTPIATPLNNTPTIIAVLALAGLGAFDKSIVIENETDTLDVHNETKQAMC